CYGMSLPCPNKSLQSRAPILLTGPCLSGISSVRRSEHSYHAHRAHEHPASEW
ncbi:hypothetical protein Tco_0643136, partial [Tanacetum coccineum]